MAVSLESPYPKNSRSWLRGNLHTHSTRSDGRLDPQEVINRYAELGYDFLALSDHDVVADYDGLDPRGMVLLTANEVSGGSPHVLDIGARVALSASKTHQKLLDDINASGGMPILSHPNWEADFNHYPYEVLASLTGYVGIEIYNGSCIEVEGSHLATDKWDRLLSAGRRVWGYANDDAHRLHHIARGWNMVAAEERSPAAVIAALRAGSFYASSGVRIESIETDGPKLHIVAPQAEQIAVIGACGRRFLTVDGGDLQFDAAESNEPFIRVECYGRRGAQAWTQPFWIQGGVHDRRQHQLAMLNALAKSTLHALRSDSAPQLTGRLDDPLWQRAEAFSAFRDMRDGKPAPARTEVRVIATRDALYVGLRCDEDDVGKLEIDPAKALWMTDSVEVFVDTEGKGMNCYHTGIGAGGALVSAARGSSLGEAPQVRGKVGRYEAGTVRGWSAELVIPLRELQFVNPNTRWGLHICRNRRPVPSNYVWSWVGSSNHNREQYGSLIV